MEIALIATLLFSAPPWAEEAIWAPVQPNEAAAARAARESLDGREDPSLSEQVLGGSPEGPKQSGLIPGVLVGPKLSIFSFPSPSVGLEVKLFQRFGVSFDYGVFPNVTIDDVSFELSSWSVGGKIYPWKGSFFVGAVLGHYDFEADQRVAVNGVAAPGQVKISSTYVAPQIGWRMVAHNGFFTGADLGWAIPVNYLSTLNVPESSADNLRDIKDKADQYVMGGLPLLGFLEIGWFL